MKKLKEYWIIILLIICVIAVAFYWLELRPAKITTRCAEYAHLIEDGSSHGDFNEYFNKCLRENGLINQ
jgi:hypothetical protein